MYCNESVSCSSEMSWPAGGAGGCGEPNGPVQPQQHTCPIQADGDDVPRLVLVRVRALRVRIGLPRMVAPVICHDSPCLCGDALVRRGLHRHDCASPGQGRARPGSRPDRGHVPGPSPRLVGAEAALHCGEVYLAARCTYSGRPQRAATAASGKHGITSFPSCHPAAAARRYPELRPRRPAPRLLEPRRGPLGCVDWWLRPERDQAHPGESVADCRS